MSIPARGADRRHGRRLAAGGDGRGAGHAARAMVVRRQRSRKMRVATMVAPTASMVAIPMA
jgi:hypothetical protein